MKPSPLQGEALARWLEESHLDQAPKDWPNPTPEALKAAGEQLEMHHLLDLAVRTPAREEAFIRGVMGGLAGAGLESLPFCGAGGDGVNGPGQGGSRTHGWFAAAALVLLCLTANLLENQRGPWLLASHGPVVWLADQAGGGERPGGKLAGGGVLSSDSLGAMARVELDDGSTVTVAGPFSLRMPDKAGGRLQLTQGSLSASVRARPKNRPLEIGTPGALLTVLGTEFLVDCRGQATRLRVDSGSVRLGLTGGGDGRDIDPTQEAEVTGGGTGRPELQVRARRPAESGWRLEMARQVEFGIWHPGKGGMGGGLEGLKGRWPGGEAGDWGRLCVMNLAAEGRGPVSLEEGGFIRLSGRFRAGAVVEIGLATRRSRGGLTGLYHGSAIAEGGGPGQTTRVEIDHQRLQPVWGESPGSPEGLEATVLVVGVHEPEGEFLLEEVAVEPGRLRALLDAGHAVGRPGAP